MVTPKRADATCLIALRRQSPFGVTLEALLALAAFAGVALAADAVHRDREVFVRLGADRAEAHRAGGEALDDLRRRLDLVERHGGAVRREVPHAAQRDEALRLRR